MLKMKMKMNVKYFLMLPAAMWQLCGAVHAQQRVAVGVTHDTPSPQVMLKLVDEKVIFPEGVTIYRSADGQQWQRLTERPLKMGSYTPTEEELHADSTLQQYISLAPTLTESQQEGATLLVMMLKSLQSLPFSRYLGVAYTDTQVVEGQTYYYKVCRVVKGREQELEVTRPVRVAPFVPDVSPDSVKVLPKDGVVTITWQPDPMRFWGVNIYRSSAADSAYRKVNELPLVASTRTGPDGKEGYAAEFYADATVSNSMAYRYRVAGIDFFGRETRQSEPVEVSPTDKTPPLFPDKVAGQADKLLVNLTWDNRWQSDDMRGYHVYRGTSYYKPFERVSRLLPAADSTYTDTVPESGSYYYYVAAVDFAGNEGKSVKISVEVPDVFPPAKPAVIAIMADSGRITITWRRNTEKDLLGYRLYRASDGVSSASYVPINPTPLTDTVFTDKLPFVAKNYFYYRLYAIDRAYNRSEPADVAYARMPDVVAPQQPFIRQVRQEGSALVVEWIPNTDDDLMGYHLYRFEADKKPSEATQVNAALLGAGAFRFTDRFPAPNVTYKYYLTAIDSSGNVSSPSGYYGGAMVAEEGSAVKVEKLKAKYSRRKKEVTLTWKIVLPSVAEEQEATESMERYKGCVLFRRTASGSFAPLTGLEKILKYSDRDLRSGERYYYQVRTYTTSGHSARSVTVELTADD
jgi:fibronectin type 3 domain-containing protein